MSVTSATSESTVVKLINVTVVISSTLAVITFLVVAIIRMKYPYELEWMEGGMLLHVQRILDGVPLYVKPSIKFIPYLYTPLYYYVCAGFSTVIGNSFFTARLVSVLATFGSFTIILLYVRKQTKNLIYAAIAVGIFAASFRISGYWFDLARADSLALFLMLCAIYTFSLEKYSVRVVLTPLFLLLAFLTKQSAIVVIAGIVLTSFFRYRGFQRVQIGLVSLILIAISVLWLNWQSNGWFDYYIVSLSYHRPYSSFQSIILWSVFTLFAIGISIFPYFVSLGKSKANAIRAIPWEILSLIVMSYMLRIHACAINVMIPAYAGIAIAAGQALPYLSRVYEKKRWFDIALIAIIVFQMAHVCYFTWKSIPLSDARQQGDKLLMTIAKIQGPVFVSSHPWYLAMVGKQIHVQEMAANDILMASNSDSNITNLTKEFNQNIESKYYEAIITDDRNFALEPESFLKYYQLADSNLTNNSFITQSGARTKPTYLYRRIENATDKR